MRIVLEWPFKTVFWALFNWTAAKEWIIHTNRNPLISLAIPAAAATIMIKVKHCNNNISRTKVSEHSAYLVQKKIKQKLKHSSPWQPNLNRSLLYWQTLSMNVKQKNNLHNLRQTKADRHFGGEVSWLETSLSNQLQH